MAGAGNPRERDLPRPIRHSCSVLEALRQNLRYLQRSGRRDWIEILEADLAELERALCAYPRPGRSFSKRPSRELRRIRLERTPFVIWHVVDLRAREGPITFLRLFHVRQPTKRLRF